MALALVEIAFGFVVGVFSALFGVGGGIILVPFMVLGLGFGQHLAEGTSLLVIVPAAVAGVIAHRRAGRASLRAGALLGSGGVAGSFVGASAALALSGRTLQGAFGVLLVVLGLNLCRTGLRERAAHLSRLG